MANLISADEFRQRFDIDIDIKNPRIEPHIGSASRRLRGWVGDTLYDQAVAVGQDEEHVDYVLAQDLKNAEAHLAFHFAIFGFNSPLSSKGVVATATASEGRVITRYLSPKETAELADQFLELAYQMARPYMTAADDTGFDLIVDSSTDAEASTRC